MDAGWTFADVWETAAHLRPTACAQVCGPRRLTWQDFDRRADGLASALVAAGLSRQDKVGLYLQNGPEYMEAAFGALKASLVPVNINYRYMRDELRHLLEDCDAAAVVFHGSFTATVAELRALCPKVRLWIHVDDGGAPCPDWAVAYEKAATGPAHGAQARSGDDILLIYTGGTTGLPRGVMWRQHDMYLPSNTTQDPEEADLAHVRARLDAGTASPVGLAAPPLMHGTGFVFACTVLNRGGTLVTLASRQFDATELLDAIDTEGVTDLCIVGDAFCRPMVEALDQHPGRWSLSTLKVVSSSGMMWSAETKQRLLAHAPEALLIDFLNASEASGIGRSLSSARRSGESARFQLGKNAVVIDDNGAAVEPGSGRIGRLAVRGAIPLGYYKDPTKTAATFPVINGVRHSIPGDFATVESDGGIKLLGRGSVSINTGGEKVFPEEVEEALKTHASVRDAVVVGVPDSRFGEAVTAAVEPATGAEIDAAELVAHVRSRLARHKAPRHVMPVASIGRGPNGKADYRGIREKMIAWLGRPEEKPNHEAAEQ